MRKIVFCAFIALLVLFFQACAIIQGTKDIATLQQELKSDETAVRCEAARELGLRQHHGSIDMLDEMAESENPLERICAIEGLRGYGDPGFCQGFYDIWLGDSDERVRKAAGLAIVENECEEKVTRRSDYAMDSKTCGYTQFFINNIKDAVAGATPGDEWKEIIPQLNIRETIFDKGTPEEILEMRLNLAFAVIDWGESVAGIHDFEDQGDLDATRGKYLSEIEVYTKKQEFVKQFCPIITFPDFGYWYSIISGE